MQGLFVAWCGRVEGMAMVVGSGVEGVEDDSWIAY